ncbi:MAG: SulP family inorganic anion transporter [Rhodospirillales bacterium]|nr:SulP family inorganic anion transporter [Alphaproteobacteria bacterium]MBL6947152.1 SulP family inorganic anion transporter [Rhodospirillales bacterium]
MFAARQALPFLSWTPRVNAKSLRADIVAALTGAVIVLPQGVAFAIIAGLPPQYGLYTAIVTPIIAALFGSSWHLVSGPTTAISLVVFSAISQHAQPGSPEFISLALTLTFMAGAYQLAFGLAQLGRLVNFVSHSVVVGFTAGAAILIVTSQMKSVLGIDIARGHDFLHTWMDIAAKASDTNAYVAGLAIATLLIAVFVSQLFPRLPNMLLAMIAGSLLSLAFDGPAYGIALIGEIPGHLPPLSMPDFSFTTFRELASQALAVAVLGLIEAVSIGRSIASKSHQRIDASQEFVGQGLSNIVGSFFSSYAGSGSFTRSGLNYASGAQTPVAAILAAVFLAVILLSMAPLTAYLPIPAMGGIILLVAWRLVDLHHIRTILRVSRSESVVLIVTFVATLLLELEFAIYAGVLLSLVLYLNRTANPRMYSVIPCPDSTPRRFIPVGPISTRRCPQLEILEINGAVFFGSVNSVARRLGYIYKADPLLNHVLIVADSIAVIDVSGAEMLAEEAATLKERGGGLYISGLRLEDKMFLKRGGYLDIIGRENIFLSKKVALPTILKRLDQDRCETCVRRIFAECQGEQETGIISPD